MHYLLRPIRRVKMILPALTEATSPFWRPIKYSLFPPLGLATLAALCPPHWRVSIVDENVEPLPLRPRADLIGIGGMGVQSPRQKQLLRYYREAGYRVVAGGSYASLCPEEYFDLADSVIVTRTATNTWLVTTQPAPNDQAYCKGDGRLYHIPLRFTVVRLTP